MTTHHSDDQEVERKGEQMYFDRALEHRERRREHLGEIPGAAAHKGAAQGLRKIANEVALNLRGPEEAVAFGRIDFADPVDGNKAFYVGYNGIWDDTDVLVVNWRADVARPYYEATHEDPQGLLRKRSYVCEKNTILDFDDVVFAELAARITALGLSGIEPDDHLLKELARNRTGEMREIVRTIQAAQFAIVRSSFDQLLVVQGGPGTGKTAVALHRVSWLLYPPNQTGLGTQDVLVVGPNRTFVRYIRAVLPSLGDHDVRHVDIGNLGAAQVRLGRTEQPHVAKLKGDKRMAGLLDRGLQQRIRVSADGVTIDAARRSVRLGPEDVARTVDPLRRLPYAAGRAGLRDQLRVLAPGGTTDAVESVLDRVWPNLTAPQFLQDLLGSQNRLLEAAGDDFSAREVQALYRQAAQKVTDETWTEADVALLDHAYSRISDQAGDRFNHIVVDEAQDLSPMQLAMVARRSSNGSMTILGDVAQSTGPWARDDWTEVVDVLARDGVPGTIEELDVGYRVPRPAFELAVRVLGDAAPGVRMPRVVREGPEPEMIETADPSRPEAVVAAARSFSGDGHLVGVICPDALRDQTLEAFRTARVRVSEANREGLGAAITIVSPVEAKGLEFDAVVVVEPSAIAAEDTHGRRQLYIAFTRTTGQLAVVYSEPFLPGDQDEREAQSSGDASEVARSPAEASTPPRLGSPPASDSATRALARHFLDELRNVVREDQIDAILHAIRDELGKE